MYTIYAIAVPRRGNDSGLLHLSSTRRSLIFLHSFMHILHCRNMPTPLQVSMRHFGRIHKFMRRLNAAPYYFCTVFVQLAMVNPERRMKGSAVQKTKHTGVFPHPKSSGYSIGKRPTFRSFSHIVAQNIQQ